MSTSVKGGLGMILFLCKKKIMFEDEKSKKEQSETDSIKAE